ncbi:MAG: HAMP domain-containing histidine kinase [Betaproteobacteria bacterium]|nr:HAMP domain-containing histidine kinase [Betaproteobacteria bacterium]
MFNTLYGKLIAVLICLGVAMVVMFLMVIHYSDNMRRQKTMQVIYRSLAAQFVNEHVLPEDAHINYGAIQKAFDRLRIINPRIDVYLLDDNGRVLAYSGKTGIRKRDSVSLDPIHRFLTENAELPILGDDPSEESIQRVFSVAPILHEGRINGYLYLVLRGLSGDNIAQQIKNNYFVRESVGLMGGGLVLALLAGALIIKLFTQRLRRLSRIVDKFQQTGFAELPPQPPSRSAKGDDIDHLAETFSQMADRIMAQMRELQHNDALRSELIANISHDLRTPLAALQGYLETLQVKGSTLSAEEKSNYLGIALKQSQQLGRLTGKLFELAKFDAGQVTINIEPFALEDLVLDVAQQFELAAASRHIKLETVLPVELPLVAVDIGMIERVLTNLIENALRYTPSGGTIRITLAPSAQHVTVQVSDTGRGIEKHDLPRVFDRFYRGEKSREDYSGNAGLGLAIAKRVLKLHRSSIAVSSEPGVGTTFSFTLPSFDSYYQHLAAASAREPAAPTPDAQPFAARDRQQPASA